MHSPCAMLSMAVWICSISRRRCRMSTALVKLIANWATTAERTALRDCFGNRGNYGGRPAGGEYNQRAEIRRKRGEADEHDRPPAALAGE